jgi:hypothetical protein
MVARKILDFLRGLTISAKLPKGVEYMNPYRDPKAFAACSSFYNKYYNDSHQRKIILGINPGRFGGGITGVPFTDPVKLETWCGISNEFAKKAELSADFIYAMIDAYGGTEKFYRDYYISALSPLGFTKDGKNLNYYDQHDLREAVEPFMIDCLQKQLDFGIERGTAFCLGEGENYKYLSRYNARFELFSEIKALPHPRFIMQYKRKRVQDYINLYLDNLSKSNSKSEI